MNDYALIILVALVGGYLLNLAATLLNLQSLGTRLPGEFEGVYDAGAYSRSQEYTRMGARFGLIERTFDLAVLLVFWFAGGFGWLDALVRSWDLAPVWTGLAFIGILLLAQAILALPFRIWSTFVIEERFGFNRTTPAGFVGDLLKGLLLAVLLGGPLVAGILWLFEYAGAAAWIYCWIAATVFILFLQWAAPTWIMPLFNKFVPLEDGSLRQAIMSYARSVSFSISNLFVIDGSKRSAKSNAFFTGFGRNKRVALYDTLIAKHTVPELVAVVAHEVGHYKKKHIIQGMAISVLHMGVLFFLLSYFVSEPGLFSAFGVEQVSVYAGIVFFLLLLSPIELVLSVLMHILSRKNEFEADRYAAETTGTPEAMIDALKKLSAHNLSNLTPHPFYVFLNYSHPTTMERIRALRGLRGASTASMQPELGTT